MRRRTIPFGVRWAFRIAEGSCGRPDAGVIDAGGYPVERKKDRRGNWESGGAGLAKSGMEKG